ncbi:Cell division protein ZipA [Marinomonas spartinae]|uniref:Cell division protein ZipA n=1 Tax=Marinomonas spartinae TaxID=1792290 RepID=A0A1A8THT9_9GAMM|nr:cell division protein ZipA [Marinomonas spartinae]SBS32841.1 Cell division protein ZipA [Marinomonas spartinae]
MEFSLREWLILIGVVIIIVILIDGFRRYKKGQTFSQEEESFIDPDDLAKEAVIKSELPNGGARPASSKSKKAQSDPVANAFENARKTVNSPLADVPHKVYSGPALDRDDEMHLDDLASLVPERSDRQADISHHDYSDTDTQQEEYDEYYDDLDGTVKDDGLLDREEIVEESDDDYERSYSSIDMDQTTLQGRSLDEDEDSASHDDVAEIEEVIVINVFAPEGETFSGIELLQLVLNCGMRYGEMDIFHRHEEGFDRGRVQFSMANAIEPGTFDLDTMGESNCPGVSFFMGLPGPKNSMKAFDFMLETAQALVRNLGGELRDERRSPMSEQTIAHCRQRIRDFERRRLTRRKS